MTCRRAEYSFAEYSFNESDQQDSLPDKDCCECPTLVPPLATTFLKIESLINEIDRSLYRRRVRSVINIESEPRLDAERGQYSEPEHNPALGHRFRLSLPFAPGAA
jgi:hypothetical protein